MNTHYRFPIIKDPIKWTTKHVHQLIDDILYFKRQNQPQEPSPYRLGTVVLYKNSTDENPKYEIVDGQQRTITLLLILLACQKGTSAWKELNLDENTTEPNLSNFKFNNSVSKYNIYNNYQEIQSRVKQFVKEDIDFLLQKCEIVIFTLGDVSECFQFFDSQNARGKDLSPHDLLKAYHLRAMTNNSQDEKQAVVEKWENYEKGEIENLLGTYLFRVKQWVKGYKEWHFGKDDIHVFKGMELYDEYEYPYEGLTKIVTEILNLLETYQVEKENSAIKFPFQLDQMSINGKHFFKMVDYYMELFKKYISHNNDSQKDNPLDHDILDSINTYGKRNRTGDRYIRNLFDCVLLYYIDKFGLVDIDNIIKKIFIWAYSIRVEQARVSVNSVVNVATDQNSLFKYIHEAIMHHDVHQVPLKYLSLEESKGTGMENIREKFQVLGYMEKANEGNNAGASDE